MDLDLSYLWVISSQSNQTYTNKAHKHTYNTSYYKKYKDFNKINLNNAIKINLNNAIKMDLSKVIKMDLNKVNKMNLNKVNQMNLNKVNKIKINSLIV